MVLSSGVRMMTDSTSNSPAGCLVPRGAKCVLNLPSFLSSFSPVAPEVSRTPEDPALAAAPPAVSPSVKWGVTGAWHLDSARSVLEAAVAAAALQTPLRVWPSLAFWALCPLLTSQLPLASSPVRNGLECFRAFPQAACSVGLTLPPAAHRPPYLSAWALNPIARFYSLAGACQDLENSSLFLQFTCLFCVSLLVAGSRRHRLGLAPGCVLSSRSRYLVRICWEKEERKGRKKQ